VIRGDDGSRLVRVEHVKEDGKEGAGGVDTERHPPNELLVKLLLEILENKEADRQAGQGSSQVGHVRDGRAQLLRCISVVNGETNIGTRYFHLKQKI